MSITRSDPTLSPSSIVRVGLVAEPGMLPRSLVWGSSGSIVLSFAKSRASRLEIRTSASGSRACSASSEPTRSPWAWVSATGTIGASSVAAAARMTLAEPGIVVSTSDDTTEVKAKSRRALLEMLPTFDAALRQDPPVFPPALRVHGVQGMAGVWEITFAPDGRATFEYGKEIVVGEPP